MTLRDTKWNGKPISEPGMYRDVGMAEYHLQLTTTPSISSSGLRTIWNESPAHYFYTSYLSTNRPKEKERPHFSIGRAAHHLLLQGRKGFDDEFVVRPEKWDSWRTNDSRDWRDEQNDAGKTIITLAELESIAGIATSLGRHPMIRAGLLDGLVERTLIYRDPETECMVKSRPDAIAADTSFADLKTTSALDDDSIQRSLTDFGYPQQGALVRTAALYALDVTLQDFALIFVEKTPPFCVRIVSMKPEDLDRGEQQNRVALHAFKRGINTGEWPGPGDQTDAEFLGLQPYAATRIDARLAIEIPAITAANYERQLP